MSTSVLAAPTTRPAVLYRPESAVFWVFVLAVVSGSFATLNMEGSAFHETLDANLALAPFWLAFMAFMVWLLLRFDPFRAMRPYPQVLVAGAALGATVAVPMAITSSGGLERLWGLVFSPEVLANWSASLCAPITEEAAKVMCAVVLLVLCASVLTRIAHALLVGMFVGLGFDLMEDLGYASTSAILNLDSDLAGAGESLLVRAFTAVPAHWSYTSLTTVGALLLLPSFAGRAEWPAVRRVLMAVGLLLAGPLMHFVWDAPLPDDYEGPLTLVKLVASLAFYLAIVFALLPYERRWVTARITDGRDNDWLSGVSAEVLDSLPTRRLRSALRKTARRAGGRKAAKAVGAQQDAALDLIQTHPT
jgi:RsiW-degrading membrane proteinase PrsW (M82 family)